MDLLTIASSKKASTSRREAGKCIPLRIQGKLKVSSPFPLDAEVTKTLLKESLTGYQGSSAFKSVYVLAYLGMTRRIIPEEDGTWYTYSSRIDDVVHLMCEKESPFPMGPKPCSINYVLRTGKGTIWMDCSASLETSYEAGMSIKQFVKAETKIKTVETKKLLRSWGFEYKGEDHDFLF